MPLYITSLSYLHVTIHDQDTHKTNLLLTSADPETILKEEYGKTSCKRYMTVGDCAFGHGCRFSHYTPQMIWELQQLGNHSIDRPVIAA